jgi:hypothetical protein
MRHGALAENYASSVGAENARGAGLTCPAYEASEVKTRFRQGHGPIVSPWAVSEIVRCRSDPSWGRGDFSLLRRGQAGCAESADDCHWTNYLIQLSLF